MTDAPAADLRFGAWEDVLQGVECDALIVDAPYSERTHKGHDSGAGQANAGEPKDNRLRLAQGLGVCRRPIDYSAWSAADVDAFVDSWAPRTRGWIVSITDHVLSTAWSDALERAGRAVFSPLAFVAPGSRVRLAGDGPSQWSCWVVVARPRAAGFAKWGTLPGAYVLPRGYTERGAAIVGSKPLWLMRSLARDYSRAGDLICDPCAGGATTLLAAVTEGRRAVGAEQDPDHYAIAQKRLARGYTPTLFAE